MVSLGRCKHSVHDPGQIGMYLSVMMRTSRNCAGLFVAVKRLKRMNEEIFESNKIIRFFSVGEYVTHM